MSQKHQFMVTHRIHVPYIYTLWGNNLRALVFVLWALLIPFLWVSILSFFLIASTFGNSVLHITFVEWIYYLTSSVVKNIVLYPQFSPTSFNSSSMVGSVCIIVPESVARDVAREYTRGNCTVNTIQCSFFHTTIWLQREARKPDIVHNICWYVIYILYYIHHEKWSSVSCCRILDLIVLFVCVH